MRSSSSIMALGKGFVAALVVVFLGACGGGGGGGSVGTVADTGIGGSGSGSTSSTVFGFQDTGVGGSGGAVGPVQGFGSIIVNELELNIDAAEFEIEGELAGVGIVGQSKLKEGQQVVVPYDVESFDGAEYEAVEVFYRSNVKGPLTAITVTDLRTGSADLRVLGQSVVTNAATRFSGGAALDTLMVGDELEVSGVPDADGLLVATFVELKATQAEADAGGGLAEYKVVGVVANDDGTRFNLDGLRVDYSTTGFDASNGQSVEVKIDPADFNPASPATAMAREVEKLPDLRVESSAEVEFEGFITAFSDTADPAVKNFVLNGIPVTTNSGTGYEDGATVENLADNLKVEVEGTVNGAGTLVAEKIALESTNAVRAESTVRAVDLTARTVETEAGRADTGAGLLFRITDLTELKDERDGVEPFTLDDLQAGDYVEIRGFLDGGVVKAVELNRDDLREDHRLRAPVLEVGSISAEGVSTLVLFGGVTVQAADGVTDFRGADGSPVSSLADFFSRVAVGTFVEARWDLFTSNTATVDALSIEEDK